MRKGSWRNPSWFRNMQIREKIREEITRLMIDNRGQLEERESLLSKRFGNRIVHNYRWKKATLRIQSSLTYVFDLLSKIK